MARITFVYNDFESLGVEYLMAVCKRAGHTAGLVFYRAEDTYLGLRKRKLNYDKIAQKIASDRPKVAAFSCVTDNFRFQLACAGALKRINPDIITIFGGVHISSVPDRVIENSEVDAVAIGEGEISLPMFLSVVDESAGLAGCREKIRGIVYKGGDRLVGEFTEGPLAELDLLPVPDKGPFREFLLDGRVEYRIMTSRGCPFKCAYCFNSCFSRDQRIRQFRQRSVENVIEQLQQAKADRHIRYVLFLDDCFTMNSKWLSMFCEQYRQKIALPFACISSPFYMNKAKARWLGEAGCINMQIGIQSLSEELCSGVLQRKSSNKKIADVLTDVRRAGIMTQVDHMLGIPGDNIELQEYSALFYNRYRPNLISIFWLTYYPGTAIIDYALKKSVISDADVEKIKDGIPLTKESYLSGGSMKNPRPFYAISFLFNWLPLMPAFLISFLIHTRLYRLFRIKNYLLSTALPRIIQSLLNRKDFRGRSHIRRFISSVFPFAYKKRM